MRPAPPLIPAETTTPSATAIDRRRRPARGSRRRGARGRSRRIGCIRRARERGGDDRLELQRRAQEEAAHRPAVLVVVAGHAARRRVAHGAETAAVVVEFGGEDRPVAGERVACVRRDRYCFSTSQLEPVARLQLGVEVDLAAEDVGEAERRDRCASPAASIAANSDGCSRSIRPAHDLHACASSRSATHLARRTDRRRRRTG